MLLGRKPSIKVSAADISEKAVELTKRNTELNGFFVNAVCGDIRNYKELFYANSDCANSDCANSDCANSDFAGKFDLVISNPPYFQEGSGKKAAGYERAVARRGKPMLT
jgi:tRNA1(Val) A37 N6-methylase TrmN6